MSKHGPQVAIVTGASRGAGKGIAIGLGRQGMTVYVTGRERRASGARCSDAICPEHSRRRPPR